MRAYMHSLPARMPSNIAYPHSHSKRKWYLCVTIQQSEKKKSRLRSNSLDRRAGLFFQCSSLSLACYIPHYSCLRILATLNWDTEKTQLVLCKRSKDSFTGLVFVLFETISLTIFIRKHRTSRTVKVKTIPKRLCHNRYVMRKLHNSYPYGDCFLFFSFLPSFLPFQKLLVTPTTLLHYSHTYIGAIIQSTEHTDTTVCHDVTRLSLRSAGGLFKFEADVRLES